MCVLCVCVCLSFDYEGEGGQEKGGDRRGARGVCDTCVCLCVLSLSMREREDKKRGQTGIERCWMLCCGVVWFGLV